MDVNTIYHGDTLEVSKKLPDESVDCIVTSPPYWSHRDYGVEGQLGQEETPGDYIRKLVEMGDQFFRILKPRGTLWLNMGDAYVNSGKLKAFGYKHKDLVGLGWWLAFNLRANGWYLRQCNVWHKPNPTPESCKDRCTTAHEFIFLLSKNKKYYYDYKAIEEPAKWERWGNQTETKKHPGAAGHLGGKTLAELPIRDKKNKRSVWRVPTSSFRGAHFAVFPPALIKDCILAGCPPGGVVLDPFMGSGTVGLVAKKLGRNYLGIELNSMYIEMAQKRIAEAK